MTQQNFFDMFQLRQTNPELAKLYSTRKALLIALREMRRRGHRAQLLAEYEQEIGRINSEIAEITESNS